MRKKAVNKCKVKWNCDIKITSVIRKMFTIKGNKNGLRIRWKSRCEKRRKTAKNLYFLLEGLCVCVCVQIASGKWGKTKRVDFTLWQFTTNFISFRGIHSSNKNKMNIYVFHFWIAVNEFLFIFLYIVFLYWAAHSCKTLAYRMKTSFYSIFLSLCSKEFKSQPNFHVLMSFQPWFCTRNRTRRIKDML